MIITINPKNPQPRLIRKVVEVLEQEGVIGYPTDTIYGVGCDLFKPEAIRKIHRLKKIEGKKPLSFICSDLKDISRYAYVSNYAYKMMKRLFPGPYTFVLKATKLVPKIAMTKQKTVGIRIPDNKICLALVKELGHPIISRYAYVSNYAYKMMKRLFPGPYTFVLKATKLVPKIAMTKQKTVGIRIPDNKICLALVKALGHPIISTSVYRPDEGLYNDPTEIEERFGKQLDLVIDGGVIIAEHSSIIDLTDDFPKVIRKGKGDVSLFE